MDLQLKGQKALITGGSKGIGRAIAESLAAEGCNVAICARNEAEVAAAVESLAAKDVTAFGQSVDVGDAEALKAWVAASAEALGGIDCVVSNVSGGNAPGEDGWRANFEHDVLGSVRIIEASMAYLENSENASIVLISSTAAPYRGSHCTTVMLIFPSASVTGNLSMASLAGALSGCPVRTSKDARCKGQLNSNPLSLPADSF